MSVHGPVRLFCVSHACCGPSSQLQCIRIDLGACKLLYYHPLHYTPYILMNQHWLVWQIFYIIDSVGYPPPRRLEVLSDWPHGSFCAFAIGCQISQPSSRHTNFRGNNCLGAIVVSFFLEEQRLNEGRE